MSNIYIQEPPTSGKVLMKTSAGEIDIELWTREAPKTCRNFIQLCMEGYYNGTIFHRIIKGFIAQGGDPNGDGTGGESIYGEPFKDEFHSRLRFCRRGLIASANSGRDDNGSQFFFTLGDASELQNKHTIFGKVTGDTLFNMLKLEDGEIDANERPLFPYKIIKTEVLLNPFDDIVPRQIIGKDKKSKSSKKTKEKGVKNFGLLSFGEEAEEDEEEVVQFVQKNSGKAKSLHDVVDDPKLSKETQKLESDKDDDKIEINEEQQKDDDDSEANRIRDKLKGKLKKDKKSALETDTKTEKKPNEDNDSGSDSDDYANELHRERKEQRKKEAEAIRNEIQALKKEYKAGRQTKDEQTKEIPKGIEEKPKETDNELIQSYLFEQRKYGSMKKDIAQKGDARQQFTLQLLNKFKSKLATVRETQSTAGDKSDEDDVETDSWLTHTLKFDDNSEVLAKDASTKKDDWYDVYDPRNPLNKRKRGEGNDRSSGHSSSKRDRK